MLVDTNVLLRLAARRDPRYPACRDSVIRLGEQGKTLVTTSQNLMEAWNVATRPKNRNGFGYANEEAHRLLSYLERVFPRLPDPPDIYDRWRDLVLRYGVSGVQVHDARLVAAMGIHGIREILTFNIRDFERYRDMGILPTTP